MEKNKTCNRPWRYSLAMFGLSIAGYMYVTYGTFFYTETIGLSMKLIALGNVLYAVWDAFNDPIAGYLSDRTRTRWGRRKPWLLVSVPVFVLSSILFFSPPASLGTGVGLAVVKAFAELHGGRVSVKSVEGEGSEFKVELPQKVENAILSTPDTLSKHPEGREPDMQKQRKAWIEDVDDDIDGNRQGMSSTLTSGGLGYVAEPDGTSASRPLALVVDDNADVREYVAHLLGGEYDVRQAADGKEGLGMALKTVPDLIVCDVKMPVMDGLEMCRRVKAETATSHVPVILLTSNAQENQRAEGYDCGADAYITKPFSSKVLLSRVRNLLENRKRLKYVYASGADDEARDEADPDSRFMADFGRVVRERMSDSSLSVETISSALGLSRVQMYRKVKQLTGQSPVEIIRVTRLKKAERLLKTTQMTVSEISYDVGFSSPSYFSKCFKDYFGVQPGEMRETN